jgi:uncharacterized protein YhbP (UPF0306 family)
VRKEEAPVGDDLRAQVEGYLRAHHTMTVATLGPPAPGATGNVPHAANVFYAMDDSFRLVFLSKPSSLHGSHIGKAAPVAVTVSEDYHDWEKIQGVQLWGEARRLAGTAKTGAIAVYLRRFPFVRDLLREPRMAEIARNIGVYRIEPRRAAFTDNTTGVFGRRALELVVE